MAGRGADSMPMPNLPSANKEKLVDFQDDDRSEIDRIKAGAACPARCFVFHFGPRRSDPVRPPAHDRATRRATCERGFG